ncbi:Tyrosine kinase receptor Cad96Ca [Stylophora pistillata]|uniref:receptor protein-tyrosine kinase n=1 Tax=Stylophora pistillata TaxID=50429 RepID=A0A2B4SBM7_STYPI|nr:Tyrosine kinase receptor Cad96Ca [Stylophora pistillata]
MLELNVTWNKSIANGGSDILDFMITLLHANGSVMKSQNAIKETSFHLKNLRQNRTYIVMLQARNVVGYGESENITVTTLVADIPVPPVVEAVRPGVLSLNISWYSPIKHNSIEVLDYRIQVLDGITQKPLKQYASIPTTSLVIKNLQKNSSYMVEIQGRNEVGYGERAKIIGATLPQGPPDSPSISNPTIDGNNCSLKWTEPYSGKSPITMYTLYVWKINFSSDGSLSLKIFKTFNTTDTFSLKLNLEWNQSYTVAVSAWNKFGEGSSSSEERCDIGRNPQAIMLSTNTRTSSTLDEDKTNVARFSTEATTVSPKRSDEGDLSRSKKTDHFATLMIFAISSAIAIAALSVIIVGLCRKIKKIVYEKEDELTDVPRLMHIQEAVEDTRAEQEEQVDTHPPALLPRAPRSIQWEFPKVRLQIREVFGQGAFGQVAKGLAFRIAGKANWTVVAVKMLKEDALESDRQDLLSELSIMKKLPYHRHVVRLLGCVTTSANPLVIVEFASHGDLLGYLLKSRGLPDTYYNTCRKLTRVTAKKLMMFAWQIASGMNFLSGNKVVHRDLAARNVLVANGNVCKITDFGMARDVQGSDIYTMRAGGRIPAKWTAYEALSYGIYTTQSDVWSYGIVLYEIFTLGGEPYPGIQARDISRLLEKGFRMRRPKHLDKELNSVMFSCWNEDPKKRPTFGNLQEALEKIEKEQTGYMNLQSFADFSYVNICDARKVKEESIL